MNGSDLELKEEKKSIKEKKLSRIVQERERKLIYLLANGSEPKGSEEKADLEKGSEEKGSREAAGEGELTSPLLA